MAKKDPVCVKLSAGGVKEKARVRLTHVANPDLATESHDDQSDEADGSVDGDKESALASLVGSVGNLKASRRLASCAEQSKQAKWTYGEGVDRTKDVRGSGKNEGELNRVSSTGKDDGEEV